MKNLFLLPSDKPSRLAILHNGKFHIGTSWKKDFNVNPQNIYITNDEEIKEGDWFINTANNFISFASEEDKDLNNFSYVKKIILTDNKDLIKDGVQAIPDEFLEWFIKNPSCEVIEVEREKSIGYAGDRQRAFYGGYKIIIPKEEPKKVGEYQQDLFSYLHDLGITALQSEMQEIERIVLNMQKEQDKKMYSEEDLREAFFSGCQSERQIKPRIKSWEQWFEKFKNK